MNIAYIIIIIINVIGAVAAVGYVVYARSQKETINNELRSAVRKNHQLLSQIRHLELMVSITSDGSAAMLKEITILKQHVRIGAIRIKRLRNKLR